MLMHYSNINQLIPKDQASITDFKLSSSEQNKYDRNHPRQKVITSAIMDMIIKNLIPAHIIEKDGFPDFIHTLDPKYTIVS